MPATRFDPMHMTAIGEVAVGSGVPPGVTENNSARIKRMNAWQTNFARNAPILATAEFQTRIVAMDSLNEIFGASVSGYYLGPRDTILKRPIRESVSVQISVNGGATYLRWNGAWVAAGVDEYTSLEEFNERCSQFVNFQNLVNPKSLSFRIRLSRYTHTDGVQYTPVLTALHCHVEWESNPYLDLFRTTKERLDTYFRTPVLRQHRLTAAEAAARVFPIVSNYTVDGGGVFSVFNVTQDPNKNTNLFSAYDAGAGTISLIPAAAVAENDILEFNFSGSAPVFVVRPDEMTTVSDIPAVIVTVNNAVAVSGRASGRVADFKRGSATQLLRIRNAPVYRRCGIRVEAWARSAREAIASIQSLERILDEGLQSMATGELFRLVITNPSTVVDYGDQSYYSGAIEFDVYYFDHAESYEEVVGIQTLVQSYGNFSSTFSNTTVNSVGVVHETV